MMQNVKALKVQIGDDGPCHDLRGRVAQTASRLIDAGEHGITSMEDPAPRIAHYVFLLRRKGIVVETVTEAHAGPYAGTHARYKLRTPLIVVAKEVA